MNDTSTILMTDMGELVDISVKRPLRIGLVVCLLFFGIGGIWVSCAPIQGATHGTAIVKVKDNRKTVQHLEGGIVHEMYVREGDWVKAGDPLVKLDDTQARAQLDMTMGQYYSAKAEESRLLAERIDADFMTVPPILLESLDTRAKESVQAHQNLFKARRSSRSGQREVLEQRIEQLGAKAAGVSSLKGGKQSLIESFNTEIKDYQELLEEGYSDRTRLRDMERQVARLESEVAEQDANLAGIKIQAGETELEIIQLERDFQTAVADDLEDVQTEVFDQEERIRALSDRLRRTEIISPVTGRVLGMNVHTIGGVVRPGEPILDVVPAGKLLQLSAQIKPADIDRVHIGQKAEIRFEGFSRRSTPVIEGKLTGISADILKDEYSGQNHYMGTVIITEHGYEMLNRLELELLPGMPASVLIHTGIRTPLQYLLSPIYNSASRAMIER